jgi:hypothetical protein
VRVKNVNGTSELDCKCGSWLEHWRKFSGSTLPAWCSEKNCTNKPTVGAHVQMDGAMDRNWYIVPLCDAHNKRTETLELIISPAFALANVRGTCRKSEISTGSRSGSFSRW